MTTEGQGSRLTCEDSGRVEAFFRRLYAHVESGYLEVRALSSDKPPRSKWVPVDRPDLAKQAAEAANEQGYDVFFQVNPTIKGGQRDSDVLCGVALWSDIDAIPGPEEAEVRLEEAFQPLTPDAALFSGGGLHLYWFLKEPVDQAGDSWSLYLRALRAITKGTGGDTQCMNPSRVLRFPLSYSHKRGQQTRLWLKEVI